MPDINKKLLKRLANLARVDISDNENELLEDFEEIVDYFEKLDDLDLEDVEAMSGSTRMESVWRGDEGSEDKRIMTEETFNEFPNEEGGYNKIPPVF